MATRSAGRAGNRRRNLRPEMRWNIGPFGVKDLFTLVNLLGGIFAVHFVVDGAADLRRLRVAGRIHARATRWTARSRG